LSKLLIVYTRVPKIEEVKVVVSSSRLPRLVDIDDVRPVDATDQVVFDEVRKVLARHGALQRFGLTLLHQHFDVGDG
jgi:hypothetical protein